MFLIHFPKTPPSTFVHSGILVVFLTIYYTRCGNIFHVDLHLLSRIFRFGIRFGLVFLALVGRYFQIHAPDYAKHTFIAAGIAFFPQLIPQTYLVVFVVRIVTPDELIFFRGMLPWVVVRATRTRHEAFPCSVVLLSPVINHFTADFVPHTCFCCTIFQRIFHYLLTKTIF